ncbi:LysM peptidoglycan-binding domain-containing protein [Paenibacillus tritici]|uniref:LysM peptidoglycan-binding domain-containing protein n=1 Tax=Paenibacillus tritici TaxID=1873425 RepID=A0ABX2DMT1_9BACL|nr:LysM peptidoglycan-binding domain-containing protein [Paenibacillus tritici]
MFDQSHGLRFDIYERIHLSEELPGIAELEEVELVPDIQVIQREDRAELHGQLLLTGLYRGEDDRTQRLEHAIPVEITVPLTRVSSLDDIGVEIENFDIDLLTMRTVNITGVLSLRGIGSTDTQSAWQQEEYTVAYSPEAADNKVKAEDKYRSPENDALYENSLWTYGEGEGAAENSAEEQNLADKAEVSGNPLFPEGAVYSQPAAQASAQLKDKEPRVRTHNLDTAAPAGSKQAAEPVSNHFLTSREKTAEAAPVNKSLQEDTALQAGTAALNTVDHWGNAKLHAVQQPEPVLTSAASDAAALLAGKEEGEAAEEIQATDNEVFLSAESVSSPEEKQDLKVALGSKKEPGAAEQEPLTFSSLLSSSRANKEQEDLNSEEIASQAAAAPEAGNDTAWKSRFIGGLGGTELFRKVRLCIVQREETLDTIAEKYQLSTRELSMYNRLSGQIVEEGQVLYIP